MSVVFATNMTNFCVTKNRHAHLSLSQCLRKWLDPRMIKESEKMKVNLRKQRVGVKLTYSNRFVLTFEPLEMLKILFWKFNLIYLAVAVIYYDRL